MVASHYQRGDEKPERFGLMSIEQMMLPRRTCNA